MLSLPRPRVANDEVFELAEGPLWDPVRSELLWVDIDAGLVLRGRLNEDDAIEIVGRITLPRTVGAVAVAPDGALVLAIGEEVWRRSRGGELRRIARVCDSAGARRLNDGKPDPAGRFVVGTLLRTGRSDAETLVRIEHDGSVTTLDDDLTLSNGLAWSGDGRRLYSADTYARRVHVRDYDAETGETGVRSIHLSFDEGAPDGMCMDADDHLWIAMWGLGQVRRYAPDGSLVARVDLPAPHTTCPAFAGPDLDVLVITTATENLTPEQRRRFPDSGRLFTLRPGVRGQAPRLWSGMPR